MSIDSAPVRTTCPYCGVGCGVLATPDGRGGAAIQGDPDHPANRGRLCSKGSALGETLSLDDRLLYPEIRGRRVAWEQALDTVATALAETVRRHGPDSVAFYVSGQLLTEDYYVANKLIKGFIGTANIDSNSRLCMASAAAGHRRAFGSDTVPVSYDDVEQADLVVLVGSNLAWCHPVLFQRLAAAKQRRPGLRVVNIDPRSTATNDIADLHLALRSGSDVALFNGLLAALASAGRIDRDFVGRHVDGLAAALDIAQAEAGDAATVARACDIAAGDIQRFFDWFAATDRVVTLWSQGVNQSSAGVDKVSAIINCHLATGRIGRPGMGPFSITGQPNAMGGREVGALANLLAGHLEFDRPGDLDRVRRFWNAPNLATGPGLKAVDMFRAIEAGRIKAVWIMATNPAVSLPDADQARRALRTCDFVAVSDCIRRTDTADHAHARLPALAWGEKEGTVTNSERCVSRQAPFLAPPGAARADWWIISQVAARLGFAEAFAFDGPAAIFREHAALTAFENGGARDLDLGAFADVDADRYRSFKPVRWPAGAAGQRAAAPFFADGRFFTADGRARIAAVRYRPPAQATSGAYPFVLNTGRYRDQWHTMTRTGKSARLAQHRPEPLLDLHPDDAKSLGLESGDIARVETPTGATLLRVRTTVAQARGTLFAPMHWSDANAGGVRVNAAINPEVDPISGQPELKHTPARVTRAAVRWTGTAFARWRLPMEGAVYWAEAKASDSLRYEMAGDGSAEAFFQDMGNRVGAHLGAAAVAQVRDRADGRFRAVWIHDGRLMAGLFVGRQPDSIDQDWLAGMFEKPAIDAADRAQLLAGRSGAPGAGAGRVICACHGVGEIAIRAAIAAGAATIDALGAELRCGTNCGSCLPELRALLLDGSGREAA